MPIGDQVGRREDDIPRRIRALEQAQEALNALAGSAKALAQAIQTGLGNLASSGTTWAGPVNSPSTVAAAGAITGASVSASGNITASGQVISAAPVQSQGSFAYHVAHSYQAMWIDGVTYEMGISASSEIVKTDLVPMAPADAAKLLGLIPYWGRYVWDDPQSPPKVFLLAEDVQTAGFGPDVAPVADAPYPMVGTDGKPILDATGQPCVVPAGKAYSINYSQLVVPLVAVVKNQQAEIADLNARLKAANIP